MNTPDSNRLQISSTRALPLEAVTQTFAILGIRGSGKTNSGVDMAEEMLKAGQQIVVLDPVDVWWGLRSSRDGAQAGFLVAILGGEHGDVPLEGGNGTVIADFVVDSGTPVVLSLRHLSLGDQRRFATDFAERLYRRKGEAGNRGPLHLFVDECDEFIPQNIQKGGERMFGAFDRLVRRGRSSGIGMTLISQRPQVVNKSVLSQCETLICHRLLHKLDRKAVDEWISAHDTEGHRAVFMESLASLPRGCAWLWSPSWLDIFEQVEMRRRDTYDSSATPLAGTKPLSPKKLAAIDIEALRGLLKETVEKAEADDPKKLKAEIARLKARAGPVIDTARVKKLEEENRVLRRQQAELLARTQSVQAELYSLEKRQRKLIDSLGQDPAAEETKIRAVPPLPSPPQEPTLRREAAVAAPSFLLPRRHRKK